MKHHFRSRNVARPNHRSIPMYANVSAYSIASDYLSASLDVAKGFRAFAEYRTETSFREISRNDLLDSIHTFLSDSSDAWLRPTRVNADRDSWSDYGKRIVSACVGNPNAKGLKVQCRLRSDHKADSTPSDHALRHGSVRVVSSKSSEHGSEKYRFVSWQIVESAAKRAADAFDALPYQGSDRADSADAYSLAAAPSLLGTERGFSQSESLDKALTSVRVELTQAKRHASDARKRQAIRLTRTRRIVSELRQANETLASDNARLLSEIDRLNGTLSAIEANTPAKRPTAKRPTKEKAKA